MPSVGVYDLVTHLLFRGRYDEIARAIAAEAPDGATVVDLGSGTGEVLMRLARLAPSLELTGVDVDPAMVARAQAKAEHAIPAGGRRPSFVVADAGALPFPDDRWTSWSARMPSTTSPTATPHGPRSSACSSPVAARSSGTSSRRTAHPAPMATPRLRRAAPAAPGSAPHDAGALDVVRMLLQVQPDPRRALRDPQARRGGRPA